MAIRVRKFRKADAIKTSRLINEALLGLISKPYSKASIEAQIKDNSPEVLIEMSKSLKYFVATEKNKILGIGGYGSKKERLRTFFVKPKFQGKGIGKMIMERVLQEAKKDKLKKLTCASTFYAEKFYSGFGFKKIKYIKVKAHNVPIIFVEMAKKL